MRKILLSAALVASAAMTTPAAAQYYGRPMGNPIFYQVDKVHRSIESNRATGRISHGEANRFHRRLAQIGHLAHRFQRNGISYREDRELQARLYDLKRDLQRERRESRRDRRYRRGW